MDYIKGKHAVVIGCSIGGLLAARVLSDHFEQVTILDRDVLPNSDQPRKGAPQAFHNHVMLKGGELVIAKLFPEFYEQLNASGEVPVIDSADINWFHYGFWRMRIRTNLSKTLMTRSYFEWKVRSRLQEYPNVRIVQECSVTGLLTDETKHRITGVQLRYKQSPEQRQQLEADLVVDTSGRNSQIPNRLAEMGFKKPEETVVTVNIRYASCRFKLPEKQKMDSQLVLIHPEVPKESKFALFSAMEGGLWSLSLAGYWGDYPPEDIAGFLEFARQLDEQDVYEAVKNATPVSEIKLYRPPSSLRRRYEKLAHFPEGLIVLGDALCSFNPVFGQGMSVAAMSANILDESLREQSRLSPGRLTAVNKLYFQKVRKLIDIAWRAAITEDFRFPQAIGKRPAYTKLLNWYMGHLFELASVDARVCLQVILVQNLVAKQATLFAPYILWQVLKKNVSGKHAPPMPRPTEPVESNQSVSVETTSES
jgi:2-polyprenyl-6-methoxyphenol hydroxylase-like FAD-dependent oxidoreductase